MLRRLPWFGVLGLTALSCFVDLDDRPGRTCNERQPCSAPRECIAGQCYAPNEVDPRSNDGGTDGGMGGGSAGGTTSGGSAGGSTAGGSSGGSAGGMSGGSAGGMAGGMSGGSAGGSAGGMSGGSAGGMAQALWRQPMDGFPAFTLDTGCTAMVDAANANQLNASVMSAVDSEDSASGDIRTAAQLPAMLEGAAKGKLRITTRPTLIGNLPFMELSLTQSTNIHVQLAITQTNQLQVLTQAGTLADNAVMNTYTVDGGFSPGDYTFEVRWRRGGTRRVWMNGQMIETVNLPATGAAPAVADRFRVGIMRLDGTGGDGESLAVRAWQIAGAENATLGDLP